MGKIILQERRAFPGGKGKGAIGPSAIMAFPGGNGKGAIGPSAIMTFPGGKGKGAIGPAPKVQVAEENSKQETEKPILNEPEIMEWNSFGRNFVQKG